MFHQRLSTVRRISLYIVTIIALLSMSLGEVSNVQAESDLQTSNFAIVFASRKIPADGSVYMQPTETGSLPGVGPYSRFQVSAPGKLIVREANGAMRILVDGSTPTAASLNLIDVNAPDVSYDATRIVFAGLTAGSYSTTPLTNPGAWRIYVINVDGTGLRQVTISDQDNLDLSQFRANASNFVKYDDFDPVWLPDGRIVFSSTRWPSFGQYGGVRTSNLHVVNSDGTKMHRITSERNAAERALVDPLTGKIVYTRWWRNFRLAEDSMATIPSPNGGYIMKDGLLITIKSDIFPEVGGFKNLERNSWHLATVNPDGTGLAQWAGASNTTFGGQIINHAYGGSFTPNGSLFANFFPMANMTEAAGFGGIRFYQRGPNGYTGIIGITTRNESVQRFVRTNPNSYGIYQGSYAAEPEVLPDGRLIISWARDIGQDYGLYTVNADGSNLTLLYDNPGTTEIRTRVIRPRTLPPIIPDRVTRVASLLPPLEQGPYDIDGTFTFRNHNVYFNAPVDVNILSAIPVGSANTIRFFIDHQRYQQTGSVEALDWPILLQEMLINADGSVTAISPANVPMFEQIRSRQPEYDVPLTGRASPPELMTGAAHVSGMNFGRPGDVATCVGCHAGHSMIAVPANPADALWTNLAPGAAISVSSLDSNLPNTNGLIDRRVKMAVSQNNNHKYWQSSAGQSPNAQWVQLTFPVPVTVRTIRLYNIPSSDSAVKVEQTTVRLYSDAAGTIEVANQVSGQLSENGTDVSFNDTFARVVRVEMNSVNGSTAGLAEVEVIARGEAADATGSTTSTPAQTPMVTATNTPTPALSGPFVSTEINPTSLGIGGTATVSVNLNNVPVEGYKSAEFTCTFDAGLVEKSNIIATNLFGADPVVAIHDPQNGAFIVAIAGTNSNKATTSGPAFTFSVKGLQAGQSVIQCTARVSKGDNVAMDLPATGSNLTIGVEPSPTPFGFPTSIPNGSPQPSTTNIPLESPTPTSSFTPLPSPNGLLNGQVIASKPVIVTLLDANNAVVTSVPANTDGTFSLTALAGEYTVVATASGFLSHQGSAILTAGNTIVRPAISLLAGDVDGNNVIDQFDALTVGMSYTSSSPAAADLNNDGIIDFLDLELLAENYRQAGPSVWE